MRFEGFVVGLVLAGCNGAPPDTDEEGLPTELGDCASGTSLTWVDVEPIFVESCTSCHSTTLEGPLRNSAPAAVNYDTPEVARNGAFSTWTQIRLERMPLTGGPLVEDDALVVWEWLSCGGPA
ncbi:MAG: hypothetical protein H6737_06020 [Alphaproteobacteria bacterium]|nr:hypothetical protein [Alphaproteobacteria bacterium]